jgi:hypothetical protein
MLARAATALFAAGFSADAGVEAIAAGGSTLCCSAAVEAASIAGFGAVVNLISSELTGAGLAWTSVVAAAGAGVSWTAVVAAAGAGVSWTGVVAAAGAGVSWTGVVAAAGAGLAWTAVVRDVVVLCETVTAAVNTASVTNSSSAQPVINLSMR